LIPSTALVRRKHERLSIWVYGDEKLARGSGLFIPHEGIACNHHFLLPADASDFQLATGNYKIRVYAKIVGQAAPTELNSVTLHISPLQAEQLLSSNAGIYFDCGPDQQAYSGHVENKLQNPLRELLTAAERQD
jgi:hypothetical protein